jgi:succinyl-CoA synthetase alpha subunit
VKLQIKTFVRHSEYHDSVSLMLAATELSALPGVVDAAVLMGTESNKSFLKQNGMLTDEAKNATPNDLVIAIKAEVLPVDIAKMIENVLTRKTKTVQEGEFQPKTLRAALGSDPNINFAVISVAGRYAAREAWQALRRGLHVLLFSDNVSIEDERALKEYAVDHGLLLMGAGAGTAIINGVGLGFANAVQRGPVGIVSAAGTGLQEVSCLLAKQGVGISQAIGTGGRDLSREVGGIMFLAGIKALQKDPETQYIILVSKPPHPEVAQKVLQEIKKVTKPCVVCLLGSKQTDLIFPGVQFTRTLEETAYQAAWLTKPKLPSYEKFTEKRNQEIRKTAEEIKAGLKPDQRYLRGLYSGGTLCYETQIILNEMLGKPVISNAPIDKKYRLVNSMQSEQNTVIDLGEEEFTVGRPHPMIDNDLRIRRLRQEARDPQVAVILLDMVIGYGAHPDPAAEFAAEIRKVIASAKEDGRRLNIILSVTGTEKDPQCLSKTESTLRDAGVLICASNAEAAILAGWIVA